MKFTTYTFSDRKPGLSAAVLSIAIGLLPLKTEAQLSTNPDKFLGNITTWQSMDVGSGVDPYWKLWNQVTPENESKWGSVEGTKGSYNWGCDKAFNYAKDHNFTYKFHAFVWGSQYPDRWFNDNLSVKDRYAAIENWYNKIKAKYPTLPLVDVVNEAVGTHQPGNPLMKASLGGPGKTGYDWLIKAFELAYERYPNTILIYNDYNTFQYDTNNYLDLVRTLRDYGAPIDAYGCQSHDVTNISKSALQTSMNTLQNGLKMPMYITELDIDLGSDAAQKNQYMNIFPMMWEADYCAGVTLWGYIVGRTWVDNSGLIKIENDKATERPAMTWLREYMATDAAKNAKSPFPGMKKEASIYIRPLDLKAAKGDKLPIKVRATMATKTIAKVELYVGTTLIATMTEAPYITEYEVPSGETAGWKTLKAVVTTTDGATYERYGRFNVQSSTIKRSPYKGEDNVPVLPGTLVVSEYDNGASGVTYNKASRSATVATQTDGWMEYTVDVQKEGLYSFEAEVASTVSDGAFHLSEYGFDNLTFFAGISMVPNTGSKDNFIPMRGIFTQPLTVGRHRICLNIDKGGFYIKNITFKPYEKNTGITLSYNSIQPSSPVAGDEVKITMNARCSNSTIASVSLYANDRMVGTVTEAPYTFTFVPAAKGKYTLYAIATDAEGRENQSANRTLNVRGVRLPYTGTPISIPGIIQAENFDKGGEGLSFHDSDSQNEGDSNYRSDSEGVDMVKGNGGVAIGYTAADEWLEYSVDVKKAGKYTCVATASSGSTNSGFKISLVESSTKQTTLWTINVPQTANNDWGTYMAVEDNTQVELKAGQQILRLTIAGAYCNIDKFELKAAKVKGDVNGDGNIDVGDIMAIINYMAGDTEGIELADANVNGDGTVDVGDIMAVINLMAGVQ